MRKEILSIILISIIINSGLLLIMPTSPIVSSTYADSSWTQTTELEFKSGKLEQVTVDITGNVTLAQWIKYNEDEFYDDAKIGYIDNLTLDTKKDEIRLSKGKKIFTKTLGGPLIDIGYSIQQTSDGGFIIIGMTTSYGHGARDIWLIKTDSYCNILWDKTFGGSDYDIGWSIQQTSDGGYIIIGETMSYDPGNKNLWLIKTDSYGNEKWNKVFGGMSEDFGKSVQQTFDGGYIITGTTYSFSNNGWHDAWLIKTDSSGNEQWNKAFGGIKFENGNAVRQTSDGYYVIIGRTESYGAGKSDLWFIKTDSSGNMICNKTFGSTNGDYGESFLETSDGGFIITGRTASYGAGSYDVWLIKTDKNGNELWNKTYGGKSNEGGKSIHITSDGGYVITGSTWITGSSWPYGVGKDDVLIIKTDSSGNEQWNRTYGGEDEDYGHSVRQLNDGGYIIVGETESYAPNYPDIWLIKTDEKGNIHPIGDLNSVNLLKGDNVSSINFFNCSQSKPFGTNILVRFSNDNLNWYNSKGKLNGYEQLSRYSNHIDLSTLNWNGTNFYYRMTFSSYSVENTPAIQNINISFSKYSSFGALESQPFDCGGNVSWERLNWSSIEPTGTKIKFQLRTGDKESDLPLKDFVGPNGKSDTNYTTSCGSIWSGHYNTSWIQFKVYLSTINTSQTPIMQNVTILFNYIPRLISPLISPSSGNITQLFNFTIEYLDYDNTPPGYIEICIDGLNYSMNESNIIDINFSDGKSYWYTTKLSAGNHSYQFFASDGELNCSSEKTVLKVDIGPLDHIVITPSSKTIITNESQIFIAKGYDADNNSLTISSIWAVNGGGVIDQNGNFTATSNGTWTVYANYSDISGNVTIKVLPLEGPNNNNNNNNKVDKKKSEDHLILIIGVGIISIAIIIILLYIFVFKKKPKIKEVTKEEKAINEQNIQQQIFHYPQQQQPPTPPQRRPPSN